MPILNKAQIKRKVKASTSLHKGNEDGVLTPDESGQEVVNNMSVDTLIDPEDYDAGGNTHFSNEETSHPTLASTKGKSKVKANENADGEEGGTTLNPGTTNVGTIPNEVDPDQGYIGAGSEMEGEVDDEDFENDEFTPAPPVADDPDATFDAGDEDSGTNVEASDTEMQNNMAVDKLTAADEDEDEEDWDAPPPDDEDDVEEIAEEDEESGDGGIAIEEAADEVEDTAPVSDEDLSILDIDETPDDEVEDVAFATFGTRLMAIKANRIIATMTARMAVNAGRNDVYLSDQFQQVTAMQIQQKGLRKGLKSMGFTLAKVNVSKQSNIKAVVQKQVHKTTAAVRQLQADKEKVLEQSLAIASVGINSQMFKGVQNELKASLEGEFRRLGIRGASKILTRAFAEHGPAYAKQVLELAKKISAMPEEVRDGYVDALDMNDNTMDVQDEDMIPVGAADEDMDDDFEDGFGETLHASLARPGTRIQASVAASGKYSVTANEILNGSRPLF